jgi:hypothetical protein
MPDPSQFRPMPACGRACAVVGGGASGLWRGGARPRIAKPINETLVQFNETHRQRADDPRTSREPHEHVFETLEDWR